MSQQDNPYTDQPYSAAHDVMHRQAAELPVSRRMSELLQTIRNSPVTIIVGETGSGKSTQIPKRILESLPGVTHRDICLTQPRKLAAQFVSHKVSHMLRILLQNHSLTSEGRRAYCKGDGSATR